MQSYKQNIQNLIISYDGSANSFTFRLDEATRIQHAI